MLKKIIKSVYYNLPYRFFDGKAWPCRNFVIELTYRCNLTCTMCYIKRELKEKTAFKENFELETDEVLIILDQLPKGANITLTGGEVFLKEGIGEILRKAAEKFKVTIASNGALLGKYAELIVQSGVQAVGISLDGPPEIHDRIRNYKGLFEKMQTSLIKVNEAKIRMNRKNPAININAVILEKNHSALPELVKLVKAVGADSCTMQLCDPSLERSGLSLRNFINYDESPMDRAEKIDPVALKKSLLNILQASRRHQLQIRFLPGLNINDIVLYYQGRIDLRNWSCALPWTAMRISPLGDVYPCLNLSIGNIRRDGLAKLWNNHRFVNFRQSLKKQNIFKACAGCCKMLPKN